MGQEGCVVVLVGAAILGVFKAITYSILFWACSIPCVSAAGGRRFERAVWAGFVRALIGVFTTPAFFYFMSQAPPDALIIQIMNFTARLLFWVGTAQLVYRSAPFPSRGFRAYFLISIAGFGLLLNLGWDRVFFQGNTASRGGW